MMRGCCEQLEIDTKDICLLCLGSNVDNSFDSLPSLRSLQGLKHLLRYLKVSPKQLFNCSTEFLQSMEIREDIDLKISLCSKCSSVTEKFNQLYQEYELIQLQFGNCVQSLHESMSKGNENPERVRKYKDQMRPKKSADLVNASIAANLRNETLKKCSLKLQSETPRVRVTSEIVILEKCREAATVSKAGGGEDSFGSSETQFPVTIFNNDAENRNLTCVPILQGPSFQQSFTEAETVSDSDIETVAEVKPTKINMNRKKNYFNSIRKKLKTKSQPTSSAPTSTSGKVIGRTTAKICEYCRHRCSSSRSFRVHMYLVHPDHCLTKFLPSNISSDLCKQGARAVWEQMFAATGTKCQFCTDNLARTENLKRHLIGCHAEQFAAEVLKNIQSLAELTGNQTKFPCEHCDTILTSSLSLRHHTLSSHPEHIVHNLFPYDISLETCRQAIDVAIDQMKQASDSGYKCKFCQNFSDRKNRFKIHVMNMHAQEMALEAQLCIASGQHLEVASNGAGSSTLGNQEFESDNNSNADIRDSMPLEVNFEETESFIKLESSPPENVGMDPLDEDYMN